jgi:hypothetical protein
VSNALKIDSFGLAIEEKAHHGPHAARRLGAKLRPALGFVGPNRDLMPAFSTRVTDNHVESEPTARTWRDGYRRRAHLWISIPAYPLAALFATCGAAENEATPAGCRAFNANSTEETIAPPWPRRGVREDQRK